jgi:hypothetical protein
MAPVLQPTHIPCNIVLSLLHASDVLLHRYVPFLANIFNIVPLSWPEWQLVLLWSAPVIVIDELLKLLARLFFGVKRVKAD